MLKFKGAYSINESTVGFKHPQAMSVTFGITLRVLLSTSNIITIEWGVTE